jgi:GxxExxY protein
MQSMQPLLHSDITGEINDTFIQVHYELGYGFPESVYSAALACALMEEGLRVEREVPLAVNFRGIRVGSFRADLIVESKVLIELKAGALLDPHADAQILNYLKATKLEVALLLHFGPKPKIKRFAMSNIKKTWC